MNDISIPDSMPDRIREHVALYALCTDYQAATRRQIPVVVLDPV